MADFCTTCGGLPHPDGEELAGPPGHFTTYGRRAPVNIRPEVVETTKEVAVTPDGPTSIVDHLSEDVPKNAKWLASLPGDVRAIESRGVWKGKEQHCVGVAGILASGVRFFASWRLIPSGWTSESFWLRDQDGPRKVKWSELQKGVKDALGDQ